MQLPLRALAMTTTVIMAIGVGGCNDSDRSAPSRPPSSSAPASHKPTPTHTHAALAKPGTTCGKVRTLAGRSAKVVIGNGRLSCAFALKLVKRYYRGVKAGKSSGSGAVLKIGKFTCASTSAQGSAKGNLGGCGTSDQRQRVDLAGKGS